MLLFLWLVQEFDGLGAWLFGDVIAEVDLELTHFVRVAEEGEDGDVWHPEVGADVVVQGRVHGECVIE